MSHADLIHQWFAAVAPGGDAAQLRTLCANDAVIHLPGGGTLTGPEDIIAYVQGANRAFPDRRFTIEELHEMGDVVAVRFTGGGTHQSEFFGLPASGNAIQVHGLWLVHVREGKIAEMWEEATVTGLDLTEVAEHTG